MPKLVVAPSSQLTSSTTSFLRHRLHHAPLHPSTTCLSHSYPRQSFVSSPPRPLAHPRHDPNIPSSSSERWTTPTNPKTASASTLFSPTPFTPSIPGLNYDNSDHKPPDERILKLGKTLRQLSPLLPTILINPPPPHLLSPSVTLHLFPSTHPHLPTVKGRTLYRAAIWAVPVAWSSVPLVGNVKLQILSERIVRAGTVLDPEANTGANECDSGDERLVVRWRTEQPSSSSSSTAGITGARQSSPDPNPTTTGADSNRSRSSLPNNGINKRLSVLLGGDEPIFKLSHEDQFTGLFIFSFDEEGRVLTQTIEHAEDASGWERTAKFVTLTDWLIGKARGSLDPAPAPGGLAMSHGRRSCGRGV